MSGRKVTQLRRILNAHKVRLSRPQWRALKADYARMSTEEKTDYPRRLRENLNVMKGK